jgi:hypothetical protein
MCAGINRDDPNPVNARAAYMPPLRESFVMDLRPKLFVIIGAAACALLIAAANFAGLLLARVIEREGEFALRAHWREPGCWAAMAQAVALQCSDAARSSLHGQRVFDGISPKAR